MHVTTPPPGDHLLHFVRARFTERGESFHGWCRKAGIDGGYATRALQGKHTFPAAGRLRDRIVKAALQGNTDERA